MLICILLWTNGDRRRRRRLYARGNGCYGPSTSKSTTPLVARTNEIGIDTGVNVRSRTMEPTTVRLGPRARTASPITAVPRTVYIYNNNVRAAKTLFGVLSGRKVSRAKTVESRAEKPNEHALPTKTDGRTVARADRAHYRRASAGVARTKGHPGVVRIDVIIRFMGGTRDCRTHNSRLGGDRTRYIRLVGPIAGAGAWTRCDSIRAIIVFIDETYEQRTRKTTKRTSGRGELRRGQQRARQDGSHR